MSTIFRLDSSIRHDGSVSRAVSDTLQEALVADLPDATVVTHDLAVAPVDPTVWALSAFAGYVPADQQPAEQQAAVATATSLADEVFGADAVIVGAPLYNFGVSQHLKAWIDTVITEPRFSPGQTPLTGTPVFIVVARGGGYGEGTPRAGWDHATAYLERIFGDVWGGDVQLIETELTLAEVNPAMAELRDLAAANLEAAHAAASEHGKHLAVSLAAQAS